MPRRREVPKREVLPDPKFGSVDLSKFMNVIMEGGKKAVAERIIYGALDQIENTLKFDTTVSTTSTLTLTAALGWIATSNAGVYVVSAAWLTTTKGLYNTFTSVWVAGVKQFQNFGQTANCIVTTTAGQQISVKAMQASGTTRTLAVGQVNTWITVYRLG